MALRACHCGPARVGISAASADFLVTGSSPLVARDDRPISFSVRVPSACATVTLPAEPSVVHRAVVHADPAEGRASAHERRHAHCVRKKPQLAGVVHRCSARSGKLMPLEYRPAQGRIALFVSAAVLRANDRLHPSGTLRGREALAVVP